MLFEVVIKSGWGKQVKDHQHHNLVCLHYISYLTSFGRNLRQGGHHPAEKYSCSIKNIIATLNFTIAPPLDRPSTILQSGHKVSIRSPVQPSPPSPCTKCVFNTPVLITCACTSIFHKSWFFINCILRCSPKTLIFNLSFFNNVTFQCNLRTKHTRAALTHGLLFLPTPSHPQESHPPIHPHPYEVSLIEPLSINHFIEAVDQHNISLQP